MKIKHKYDIGLVGCWSAPNYGAHLTYYALYKVLTDFNYNVLMIENLKNFRVSERPPLFRINPYPDSALADIYTDVMDLKTLNKYCDFFMTGSDQLWNYNIFGVSEVFTLSFAEHHKKKIAYATSFGKNFREIPYDVEAKFRFFLNRFDNVSVREEEGVDFCRNKLWINAQLMLDPVFLCESKYYKDLAEKSVYKIQQPYIFCYITDQNEEKKIFIEAIARKMNMKIVLAHVYYTQKKEWNFENIELYSCDTNTCTVEDWMYFIYNSSMVITDSYHGYCFSLLFHKQVATLFTNEFKAYRATSLANLLGISKSIKICEDAEHTADVFEIKYDIVSNRILEEQERCKKWLWNALHSDPAPKENDFMWDAFGLEIMHQRRTLIKQQLEINALKIKDKRVVLFGAGRFLDMLYQDINKIITIDCISDNNPEKWDTFMYDGKQCVNPEKLKDMDNLSVIITVKNEEIVQQIKLQLNILGITEIHHISDYIDYYE